MRSAVFALAAALAAGTAAAQSSSFPVQLDAASLSAWLTRETDIRPDQVVAVSPSAVTALVRREGEWANGGRAVLRAEALSAQAATRAGVLAWEMPVEIDCRAGQVRLGATTGYASRRAGDVGIPLAPEQPAWRKPAPDTPLGRAWRAACEPGFRGPLQASGVRTSRADAPAAPPRAATVRPAPAPASPPSRVAQAAPTPQPPAGKPAGSAVSSRSTAKAPAVATQRGSVSAQVISSPDGDETRRALAKLRQGFGAAIGGRATDVVQAKVRGRTVYRGMVLGFASRREAAAFCATLRAGGRPCLVR